MRFHHIGIACFDIARTRELYTAQGYTAGEVVVDSLQDIQICFLHKPGSLLLELLAPVDDNSPVNRILASQGVSPYHMCYTVDDLQKAMKELRSMKFVCVSKPKPACALNGKNVCFLYHKDAGLVELLEA